MYDTAKENMDALMMMMMMMMMMIIIIIIIIEKYPALQRALVCIRE